MPEFYCMHCGQHINADESLAGSESNCPICKEAIVIPKPKQEATVAIKAPKKTIHWAIKGSLFVVGLIVIFLISRCMSNADKHAEAIFERRKASTHKHLEHRKPDHQSGPYQSFKEVEAAGLILEVPKELANMSESKLYPERLVLLHKYTKVDRTRAVEVKRFVFHTKGEWTVEKFKNSDAFSGNLQKVVTISGLRGKIYHDEKEAMGNKMDRTILSFYRGNQGWEVHVVGVNDKNISDLNKMRDRIYRSVRLKD